MAIFETFSVNFSQIWLTLLCENRVESLVMMSKDSPSWYNISRGNGSTIGHKWFYTIHQTQDNHQNKQTVLYMYTITVHNIHISFFLTQQIRGNHVRRVK